MGLSKIIDFCCCYTKHLQPGVGQFLYILEHKERCGQAMQISKGFV